MVCNNIFKESGLVGHKQFNQYIRLLIKVVFPTSLPSLPPCSVHCPRMLATFYTTYIVSFFLCFSSPSLSPACLMVRSIRIIREINKILPEDNDAIHCWRAAVLRNGHNAKGISLLVSPLHEAYEYYSTCSSPTLLLSIPYPGECVWALLLYAIDGTRFLLFPSSSSSVHGTATTVLYSILVLALSRGSGIGSKQHQMNGKYLVDEIPNQLFPLLYQSIFWDTLREY